MLTKLTKAFKYMLWNKNVIPPLTCNVVQEYGLG